MMDRGELCSLLSAFFLLSHIWWKKRTMKKKKKNNTTKQGVELMNEDNESIHTAVFISCSTIQFLQVQVDLAYLV